MGNTIIKENKKYGQGYVITETFVDGDLYKITEEYKDDNGEIVYVYEYFPTVGEIMKAKKQEEKKVEKNKQLNKTNKKLDKIKNKFHY